MPTRIVEERIRAILVYLDALKHVALLVDESLPAPGFERPQEFAAWVTRMADETAVQVQAIKEALPVSCTDREAPLRGAAGRAILGGWRDDLRARAMRISSPTK